MFHLDANSMAFFERELEHIKTKTYDVKYPNLKARALIPVSFDTPRGAKTITYKQYDQLGMAKIVANYAKDFPRVSVLAKEFTSPIKRLGDSYSWTIDDIAAAAMANVALDPKLAAAAKRAILQKENTIAFFGDSATGLPGFLTNANIPLAAATADGAGALSTFVSKSPDQIIRDINALISSIVTVTKEVEQANTVLLPPTTWAQIANTPRSSTSDTTILEFLKSQHPEITLWEQLLSLETAGTGATKMMVAYNRSPDVLQLEVPWDFEQFEADKKGLEYEVPCSSKTGGTIVYYPLACNFVYGI